LPRGAAKKQLRRTTKPFRAACAKRLKPSLDSGCGNQTADRRPTRALHNKRLQMATASSTIGRIKLMAATTVISGMLTTVGYAYTLEQQQMCSGDAMRLCSSEIPDVNRITACMERQRDSLSDGCKAVFEVATPSAATESPSPVNDRPRPSRPIDLVPKFKHG
jgi:hypothetical protein